MTIFHTVLVILFLSAAHRANSGFFSDTTEKIPGLINSVWTTTKDGVGAVAKGVINVASVVADKSPGVINSVWSTSKHGVGAVAKGVIKVASVVADKSPGVINSVWSTVRNGWLFGPPQEECTDEWIPGDTYQLEHRLRNRLYGQHMIISHIPCMIRHHWSKSTKPSKPLVMSLHGSTGVGKNYVTKIIAESLFKLGDQSKFVTIYSGRLDFTEARLVSQYHMKIEDDLIQKVTACERHVFIFDEIDKVPTGVFDVMKPFLDYNMKVRDVDFRRSIFIFISNLGQDHINKKHLSLWEQGIRREDLGYLQFEKVLINEVFNEEGGLYRSANIEFHLIDFYIPFLLLEAEHVKQCIRYAFLYEHDITPSNKQIEAVHNYVEYGPKENPNFAKTGCKSISSKVALIAAYRKDEL